MAICLYRFRSGVLRDRLSRAATDNQLVRFPCWWDQPTFVFLRVHRKTDKHYPNDRTLKAALEPPTMKPLAALLLATALLAAAPGAQAGIIGILGYGMCQTGCNTVAAACYAAAGATFGTITAGAGVPAVIIGCNSALGVCMAACAAVALSPV